jgi:hypothetical protein
MRTLLASISLGVALAAAVAAATPAAMAQARSSTPEAAACDRVGVDRAPCLQDERAARREQKRNGLVTPQAETIARNLRARCEPLPADDRQACLRRMAGEGTLSGSVEQGGLLRELVVIEPPRAAASGVEPTR